MHTIKITSNLLYEYQCTSGKLIRLPNRIESNRNFFCPNWNALALSPRQYIVYVDVTGTFSCGFKLEGLVSH